MSSGNAWKHLDRIAGELLEQMANNNGAPVRARVPYQDDFDLVDLRELLLGLNEAIAADAQTKPGPSPVVCVIVEIARRNPAGVLWLTVIYP